AEQTGLSTSYAYELLSDKREAIPSEEILNKVSQSLGLTERESKYVLALGECERKIDKVIHPSDGIDVPEAPGDDGEPAEPVPDEPDEPIEPPAPIPDPQAPDVPWFHKKVIIALIVGLAGGILIGCCGASTFVPIILSGVGY
ncbi:MAG: hypothetical protein AB1478_12235, partial [Nitrospirota bacterium]